MGEEEYQSRVGAVLNGKWTLKRLIGFGGMAAVYEAHHRIGRRAAIKVLHPEIAGGKSIKERFEQEALAVNRVGHPGVVEILDIDTTEGGAHYLVMELLDGQTLADHARKGPIKTSRLFDVVDDVLDTLVACHKQGVIHRDIKPENIFLLEDGRVKLLDFGIARVRTGVRTQAGVMLGTVAFMPPEQIKGVDVDHRVDLFAIGATMFTLLARRRLHETDSDAQLAMKMLTTPAPLLAGVVEGISDNLASFVDRALAFLPEHRYPDAQTMRGDLWSVRKDQRPPYAYACNAAGQDPSATSQSDAKQASKTRKEIPSAMPQSEAPPKSQVEPTDPQMPAFVEQAAASLVAPPVAAAATPGAAPSNVPSTPPTPGAPDSGVIVSLKPPAGTLMGMPKADEEAAGHEPASSLHPLSEPPKSPAPSSVSESQAPSAAPSSAAPSSAAPASLGSDGVESESDSNGDPIVEAGAASDGATSQDRKAKKERPGRGLRGVMWLVLLVVAIALVAGLTLPKKFVLKSTIDLPDKPANVYACLVKPKSWATMVATSGSKVTVATQVPATEVVVKFAGATGPTSVRLLLSPSGAGTRVERVMEVVSDRPIIGPLVHRLTLETKRKALAKDAAAKLVSTCGATP